MKRRKLHDTLCADLAEYFLQDVKSATGEDHNELAEAIQQLCEDFCRGIEGDE